MNKDYAVPEGYRKAQAVLLHDDHIYLVVDWTPDADERPFFHEGYYHFHPFMGDDDYPNALEFITINTRHLDLLAEAFGQPLVNDKIRHLSDLALFKADYIERYGRNEAYGLRTILALYIRMETSGAISIIIIEKHAEAGAPVVKREMTYHGKYSIYWGAEEVSE